MKTFLVTGGAGFIGSNFVHHLFHKYPDYRILVLDLLTYAGSVDNLPTDFHDASSSGRIEFWYGDVRNASLVDNLVRRADVVVHFAAETHVTRSIFDNHHFFETDVLGTQVISNAVLRAENVDRFIHISTSEVYGTADSSLMDEQHPLMPLSPYAAAKAGADRLVYSYWATYQLPATIVRPFNNFGPRQHLEKAVPRFVTSCLLDEPLRVHGDGSAARDWIYVQDTCEAIDLRRALRQGDGRRRSHQHRHRTEPVDRRSGDGHGSTDGQAGKPDHLRGRSTRPGVPAHSRRRPRPSASSDGSRRSISKPASRRPSTGIRTIAPSGRSSCGCATSRS